ncbi:protein translocase subunit SecD [Casimicrobium huifangae]|uniref:protein translocase subunit SecD n=1 Tax=Casimicrobium huifangae TaxID=2591109 RepID=UPI0012EBBDD2|nr:protein translocase subunit SecD [Casimicrobium huifangae]
MNRYPLWKYLIMIVAVVIGFFYTVPNIFPQVPAVQVSTNKTAVRLDAALLERVEKTLKTAGVAIASSELDPANGVHVRFAKGDSDSQVKAKELLLKDLNNGVADGTGNYIIALTSESTTPHWMQNLNAKPMALGLDLRGGVHFLMQVDMKGALDRAADRNASDIRSLMREKKIQYGGVDKSGETIAVKFSDPAQREKASREISDSNKDLLIKEDGAAQDLRLVITLKEEAKKKLADSAIEQNQKVLGNRINALGLTEPIIQRQGADRIVIQVPGASDPARLKDVIGRTGTLELRMVEADNSKNSAALQAAQNGNVPYGTELMNDRDGGQILVKKQYVITGERINGAEPAFDGQSNQPIVRVSTDGQGARVLRDVTGQNIGNRMAIVLIEKGKPEVITAPIIQGELGSNFQISGRMTTRETSDIALLIRSGSIAAPMEIIEERSVGPSLGAENIERGFNSVMWGFVALAAFICVYYMVMGLISTLALSVNLLLLIAILSMLQATLTLPGIAAIALTLGMAIDANVLINERIREELRRGLKPQEAISAGFDHAWATILDSNITTLIAGLALFMFGSGPVKGFAVVHCLGILTSMFSAVFFSRGIVNLVYGTKKKLEKISIGTVWRPDSVVTSPPDAATDVVAADSK